MSLSTRLSSISRVRKAGSHAGTKESCNPLQHRRLTANFFAQLDRISIPDPSNSKVFTPGQIYRICFCVLPMGKYSFNPSPSFLSDIFSGLTLLFEVIHDLDAFEEAGAVGGHMRFLKPKSGVTIIAVRGRQRYQVRQRMHSVVLKTASSNEKAFYEALGSRFAALEPFLRLG